MKFTRLKFVKGSLYMSGAQCINLDRVCSTSADALVTDAARAPVDVMLPMCILQTLSFHWCRFLSYPCTVCMSREREREIKFIGLFENRGHRGPYSPYKPFNHNLYIGIIIFPHTDNPQYTGYDLPKKKPNKIINERK